MWNIITYCIYRKHFFIRVCDVVRVSLTRKINERKIYEETQHYKCRRQFCIYILCGKLSLYRTLYKIQRWTETWGRILLHILQDFKLVLGISTFSVIRLSSDTGSRVLAKQRETGKCFKYLKSPCYHEGSEVAAPLHAAYCMLHATYSSRLIPFLFT